LKKEFNILINNEVVLLMSFEKAYLFKRNIIFFRTCSFLQEDCLLEGMPCCLQGLEGRFQFASKRLFLQGKLFLFMLHCGLNTALFDRSAVW
jgi:hypothetical protein